MSNTISTALIPYKPSVSAMEFIQSQAININSTDYFSLLPKELILHIFSFL